ncbi:hypothetical protein DQ04_00031280 [Trypanosoma grayi]|uniref:hypothetical protein n=1 Tax=Trypanosoma grayi TaxID=71804 RepID=UPI0004F44B47|nr:hypothetical protein DQ04_00031280 [Trypanosoma grayi]KEG15594.1 hypothetical protein DQ04_00031280 [Trypanosoma grayi]
MQRARLLAASRRLSGTVVSWHPFERRGVIRCDADGDEYQIPNARAFETVLPTRLHSLEGTKVEFEPIRDAQDVDRVITRSRLEPLTATSYARKTPVDFLAAFRLEPRGGGAEAVGDGEAAPSSSSSSPPRLLAGNITVDLVALRAAKGGNSLTEDVAGATEEEGDSGTRPPLGVKDLRNPVVLDADTKELVRLRRQLGDEAKAREALQQQRQQQEAARALQRTEIATGRMGIVLAWSALHRSGVVLEDATAIPECAPGDNTEGVCIIRNVDAFETALPTALSLVGRIVNFTKVAYTSHPSKFFAENITVRGELRFDEDVTAVAEAKTKEAAAAEHAKRARQLGTLFEEVDYSSEPLPAGPLYGVVTRWSGGQGIVETGNRRLYYIQSGADFKQLVDHTSNTIRGAVVSFTVDEGSRRYARDINVLSVAARDLATVMPMLERRKGSVATSGGGGGGSDTSTTASASAANSSGCEENKTKELPTDADWMYGMMVTWSELEGQGVIEGDDGNRYLLRDGEEHVVEYKTHKPLLKKGRRVKFTAFGGTGRLACNVVPLNAEADAAALAEAELQQPPPRLNEGHAEEAIASPMSTAYWISRMDKAGYDTTEVKQMQNKAITFEDDDEEDDKLLDSEELFKKDHWFNDPRKNMRLPNSDVTAGSLALVGPASMMNIAMKAHDPKKLEKMKNKYYNRLTEPMKEFAWKQAKELAPKYEQRVKEAREKGEEPRFSFY